jgi:hypothetical protein
MLREYRSLSWWNRENRVLIIPIPGTLFDDKPVIETRAKICAEEGLHLCPEGAACIAALELERKTGRVGPGDC